MEVLPSMKLISNRPVLLRSEFLVTWSSVAAAQPKLSEGRDKKSLEERGTRSLPAAGGRRTEQPSDRDGPRRAGEAQSHLPLSPST
mmetsp:Transcript_26984/g.88244  ORF Transcript_26984/g.88244 Transcript_26984/m.88244 type:complete len:86 (+) Transcript_26984:1294-1551(+)